MIDKKFWQSVAENWSKADDGIVIPEIDTSGIELIEPTGLSLDDEMDDEIADILADLGLDDI